MSHAGYLLEGGCHCGANRFRLRWPDVATLIPARCCGCTYCSRIGGTWTSHPDAGLEIIESLESPLARYQFGTGTADFLFCSRCGTTLAAVCGDLPEQRAVVNANSLDQRETLEFDRSDSDFDGERTDQRMRRRNRNWIATVRIRGADDQAAGAG